METIGVRELRQHASRYLARVAGGETIEVTDRGRPIALLVPTPQDHWQDLVARGHINVAHDGHVLDEPAGEYGISPSERLSAQRDDER